MIQSTLHHRSASQPKRTDQIRLVRIRQTLEHWYFYPDTWRVYESRLLLTLPVDNPDIALFSPSTFPLRVCSVARLSPRLLTTVDTPRYRNKTFTAGALHVSKCQGPYRETKKVRCHTYSSGRAF